MRIVQLTPGTGSYHSGSCLRDHLLVRALRQAGHTVEMVPLYLPLVLDTPEVASPPVFLGAVNTLFQQGSALFRSAPRLVDRALDSAPVLRWVSKLPTPTDPTALGEMTVSTLRGATGNLRKEVRRLLRWLHAVARPDVVSLSNALLAGIGRDIQTGLGIPVVCTLQGEDAFLDGLDPVHSDRAWELLSEAAAGVSALVAVSRHHAGIMAHRLSLERRDVHVVHNGIVAEEFEPARVAPQPARPTVGYLAALSEKKGLATLLKAYLLLRTRDPERTLDLRVAGAVAPADVPFYRDVRGLVERSGLEDSVRFETNVTREDKVRLLGEISVLSVPSTYGESFGLYVLEAWAAGVPVVQPRHGAFPEVLGAGGGGVLVPPGDFVALADALSELLADERARAEMGARGRRAVEGPFHARAMGRAFAEVLESVVGAPA